MAAEEARLLVSCDAASAHPRGPRHLGTGGSCRGDAGAGPCPAGAGERLGQGTKGFLSLAGRPLLCWVADKALQVADEVIVAVPADRLEVATRLLPRCRVLAGGGSRHDSVALLAEQARGD